jgi:hypothetical protein
VNCSIEFRIENMATKVKLMKLLQEVRGFAEIGRRHPPVKPSTLFLMQLRSHLAETSQSRHRLTITIDLKDSHNIPHPVKITHLNDEPAI